MSKITEFIGSIWSLLIHAFIYGFWIIWNFGLIELKPFDPNFVFLAMTAAIEAIFFTIFILIGQKHMNAHADKWAELDLQISLLTEQEVTRVLTLVIAIAKKMNIEIAEDKESEALSKDIRPDEVLDTIEQAKE